MRARFCEARAVIVQSVRRWWFDQSRVAFGHVETRRSHFSACNAASYGTRVDVVRLVPAQPQQTRRVLESMFSITDRRTLEQHREARLGLGPGHAALPDAVLVASYARNARTQEGLELAAIEVRDLAGAYAQQQSRAEAFLARQ